MTEKSDNFHRNLRDEAFITEDYCNISGTDGEDSKSSMFLRLGRSRKREKRDCYLKLHLPDSTNTQKIASMKLCLYQYYVDVGASSNDDFSLSFSNDSVTLVQNFRLLNSGEGKECIPIKSEFIGDLSKSDGVTLKANVSGHKKERYFLSSEWTSSSKGIKEPNSNLTYHPHWIIEFEDDPVISPSPSAANFPVNAPSVGITGEPSIVEPPKVNADRNKNSNNGIYITMIIGIVMFAFVAFLSIIYCSIMFVRRRKAEIERKMILRTFVNEDEICHTGKHSFNSMNTSSNKAGSGNSGRSLKWIENVQLDDGGGDGTICDKIDEKIDNAAFPDIEKPYFSSGLNAITPRQKNTGGLHQFFEPFSNEASVTTSFSEEQNRDDKLRNHQKHQESIQSMRERMSANNVTQMRSLSNSMIQSNSNNDSYPSLISSYTSSGEEESSHEQNVKNINSGWCFSQSCRSRSDTVAYPTNQSTAVSSSTIYSSDESSVTEPTFESR